LNTGSPASAAAHEASAQDVLERAMASRSKPENWPADPPRPLLLSVMLIDRIELSPTPDRSALRF
jgi:hypothetical protein